MSSPEPRWPTPTPPPRHACAGKAAARTPTQSNRSVEGLWMSGGGRRQQPAEQASRDVIDAFERRLRSKSRRVGPCPRREVRKAGGAPPPSFLGGGPGGGPPRPRAGGSEGGRSPLPWLQGWISPSRMAWRTRPAVSWMFSLRIIRVRREYAVF